MEERHVSLLKSSAREFNDWRAMNPGVVPDLAGADLSSLDLRGADLQQARFQGARLARANLSGCDLSGADLSECQAEEADFSRCRLMSARLDRCEMPRANLSRANLTGASLIHSRLPGANLEAADLTRVVAARADLSGTRLDEATLHSADLSHANLRDASVHRTNFYGVEAEGADFAGVDIATARKSPPHHQTSRRESRYQKITIEAEEEVPDERRREEEYLARRLRLPGQSEQSSAFNPLKFLLMGVIGLVVLAGPVAYDYFGPRTMPLWHLLEINRRMAEGIADLENALKLLEDRPYLSRDSRAEEAILAYHDLQILRDPRRQGEARKKFGDLSWQEREKLERQLEAKAAYAEHDPDRKIREPLLMAQRQFERVLELSPRYKEARFQLARCYYARGEFARAGRLLRKYLEDRPKVIDREEIIRIGAMARPVDKESIKYYLRRYPKTGK